MKDRRRGRRWSGVGVALAGTLAGTLAGAGVAAASVPSLAGAQQALEAQLSARSKELATLTSQVDGSAVLSSSVSALLRSDLASETASIAALAASVPSDTTMAMVRAAHRSMIVDNRVYAVMEPKVLDATAAAADANEAAALQGDEAGLGAAVAARRSAKGYATAWSDFVHLAGYVAAARADVSDVSGLVLSQAPEQFPKNESAFVTADRDLLHGEVALAYASYDRNVIDLFIDGYSATA